MSQSEIPKALRKLRTPEYLRMVEEITDDDATPLWGACAIGMLEADMWTLFQTVPTREMVLRVRRCLVKETALSRVAEIITEYELKIAGKKSSSKEES